MATPKPSVTSPNLDATHDPDLRSWVESANEPDSDFPIQNLPLCCFDDPDAAEYARTVQEEDAAEARADARIGLGGVGVEGGPGVGPGAAPGGRVVRHGAHLEEGGEDEYADDLMEPAAPRLGVAIGDSVLDVTTLVTAGYFDRADPDLADLLDADDWSLLASYPEKVRDLRRALQDFLRHDKHAGQQERRLRQKAVLKRRDLTFIEPVLARNYTDFYASVHHATTVGSMFRPDNPLLPNYKWVPIGYHGRASSIVPSGTPITRPMGQQSPPEGEPGAPPPPPLFGPCKMLDYELEVGAVIAGGNALGEPISIARARQAILGLCLVNDWSARDVQRWEYQPLGPFLAKNFATTISPFIVTLDALEPFRCAAMERPSGDPRPLGYLSDDEDQRAGGFDIVLEVWLETAKMTEKRTGAVRLSRGSFRDMYWTFAQMITHHTSNGCNMLPGDLIASGTVSGQAPESRGCLLELTWQGAGPDAKPLPRKPLTLPTGETRTFLQDGDTVIFRAWCEREGFRRVGFGECVGTVAPPRV